MTATSVPSSEAARRSVGPLTDWRDTATARFLRAYSDAVNRRLIDDCLPAGPIGRVLKTDLFDEAIGEGLLSILASRAEKVFAVDVSPAVVEAARASHPPLLGANCADVRRLPFVDGCFEVVCSNSTLDHFDTLEDIRLALSELHRVVGPRGRLLVTLDNLANPIVFLRNRVPPKVLRRLGLVPYPLGVTCGPRALRRLLEDSGFEVENLRALMHCPRLLARGAAAVLPDRSPGLLRSVMALERLELAPTRYLTAQFIAASARRVEPLIGPGARRWTARDAIARAITVLRTEGPRAMIARAAGETVYRRLILMERDLAVAGDAVPETLDFSFLSQTELADYQRLRPGLENRARGRLAAGHRCFATWVDRRLVAVRWLATGTPHIEYLDVDLTVQRDEIFIYDTFTDPSLRCLGISTASYAKLFSVLRAEGYRRGLTTVLPGNRAGVRVVQRAGYRPVGEIGFVGLGSWRRHFRRERRGRRRRSSIKQATNYVAW